MVGASAGAEPSPGNVSPTDPEQIRKILVDEGYRAKLTRDDDGDPLIESAASGYDFKVFFYGCTDNRDCRTIQFYAGFQEPDHGSLEEINKWNAEHRFGRAYVGDDGSARIEMDVSMDGEGMGPKLFVDNLEFWDSVMGQFASSIWD